MSFTNPNETLEEAQARWAKNRAGGIESSPAPEKLIHVDLNARLVCDFAKHFERNEG